MSGVPGRTRGRAPEGCAGILLAVLAAAPGALALPAAAATLQVEVDGIEPGGGYVRVALCQGGLSGASCVRGDEAPASDNRALFTFQGVAPGTYAVAAYQDSNGDGRLDRTGLGLPLEPYGFSGSVGRRGRPDFADAAFTLREPGASVRVRLGRAVPRR
ncbi:DUF2141 domain-containing protein [Methylobacterium sp. J-070]|uniref:DUF2141 domain-containing protein n=1 Tax=Methylobacterium sp. J-070 TaxID=2836650 RepID=UPI00391E0008